MKLLGKIIFNGNFITKTGLHIGGSKSSLTIGGIDNNVIKSPLGVPYIPGSSLKGKLRSLLARVEGALFFSREGLKREKEMLQEERGRAVEDYLTYLTKNDKLTDEDFEHIMELFGYSGDTTNDYKVKQMRLLVRDAFLINGEEEANGIFREGYTGSKWENVINRRTGTAEHPRQMERVPVGAKFKFELVYNIFDDVTTNGNEKFNRHLKNILLALELLEDDGIGGQLSRGYGKVKIENLSIKCKMIDAVNFTYDLMEPTSTNLFANKGQQLIKQFNNRLEAGI